MKKVIEFLKSHPVITAIIAVAVGFTAVKLLSPSDGSNIVVGMLRIVLSLSACAFLYLISGERTFNCCTKTTGYVLKKSWFLLLIPFVFVVFGTLGNFVRGAKILDDWYSQLPAMIVLYLFVGVFEETTFRAIINDALLIRFRNTKGIFVIISAI